MKRNSFLIISIFILIFSMTGCLPNKIPDKITGPTVATKYTIPVIKRTIDYQTGTVTGAELRLGSMPNGLGEAGLGLNGLKANLSVSSEENNEPLTFDLLDERIIISFETITDISVSIPLEISGTGGTYTIESTSPETTSIPFSDLSDYLGVTLSKDTTTYNTIDITMNGAVAGEGGFTIILKDGSSEIDRAEITPGSSSEQLSIAGMTFLSTANLSIEAYGALFVEAGTTQVSFSFIPSEIEIDSFEITDESFNTKINESFTSEPVESSFDLPSEINDFDIDLDKVEITITPHLPENMGSVIFSTDLIIEGFDDSGKLVSTSTHSGLNLTSNEPLDLTEDLNTLFAAKPSSINLRIENYTINASSNLVISYPSTITLDYSLEVGKIKITSSTQEINIGKVEIPEGFFQSAYLCFDIKNTSPLGLTIQVSLSPNSNLIEPVNKQLIIAPDSDWTRSKIGIDAEDFSYLTKSDTIYHQIAIINTSKSEEITDDHYLEIKAWMEAECLIKKQ